MRRTRRPAAYSCGYNGKNAAPWPCRVPFMKFLKQQKDPEVFNYRRIRAQSLIQQHCLGPVRMLRLWLSSTPL